MPICPKCSATIHAGSEDQCPACGYSLLRANAIFGEGQVEFTRVVDAAGALRHQERMELVKALEEMERNLPPIALCIYITDDGQLQEFRTHAHWILNHARIHHPSFGPREKMRAIEDAELRERITPRKNTPRQEEHPTLLLSLWRTITRYIRNATHPYPRPARQEWMLILVLDVQLEIACFSWGYMLDPYINPDSINSCIIGARLQFRERAMVSGLKRVMKAAVAQIAASSRRVNKKLSHRTHASANMLAALLGIILSGTVPLSQAAPPENLHQAPARHTSPLSETGKTLFQDDETPEEIPQEDKAPQPPPTQTLPTKSGAPSLPSKGGAASYDEAPRWNKGDYQLLMAGELAASYAVLFPNTSQDLLRKQAVRKPGPRNQETESDTRILGRYCNEYGQPSASGLCDPQRLLSQVERDDIEHALRQTNANSRFRIYVALFKGTQEIPRELSVSTLLTEAAQTNEYAVMLLYPLGSPSEIELGYQEIKADDATRHEWMRRVREAAKQGGDQVEGILAAIRQIHDNIQPLAVSFKELHSVNSTKVPLIPIEFRESSQEKKVSLKDKIRKAIEEQGISPLLGILGGIAGAGLLFYLTWYYIICRHSGKLLETPADVRLSSPYGAGISRYVRYLEGKEAAREKRLF